MAKKPDRGPSRDITKPQPGYWLVKLPDKTLAPAMIGYERTTHEPGDPLNIMDRPAHMVAYIAGEPVDPQDLWETRGTEISAEQYQAALDELLW